MELISEIETSFIPIGKLPDYATAYIERCLIVVADHGLAVSGVHNTIVAACADKDLVSSSASGLLTTVCSTFLPALLEIFKCGDSLVSSYRETVLEAQSMLLIGSSRELLTPVNLPANSLRLVVPQVAWSWVSGIGLNQWTTRIIVSPYWLILREQTFLLHLLSTMRFRWKKSLRLRWAFKWKLLKLLSQQFVIFLPNSKSNFEALACMIFVYLNIYSAIFG